MEISQNNEIGKKYFELIRKKTLWEEYIFDINSKVLDAGIRLKMKALDRPVKVPIPSKENIRYLHIKNFEDHDLSHNLALDMIIRNDEFQNYMYKIAVFNYEYGDKSQEEQRKYYQEFQSELIKKYGFDIKDEINLLAHHPYINEQITNHIDNVANESLILNPPFIRDLKNGVNRVIDFYFNKQKLYILIPSCYEKIDDENLENINDNSNLYVKIVNPTNSRDNYILLSIYEENTSVFNRIGDFTYKLLPSRMDKIDEINDDFIVKNFLFLGIPVATFGKEKIVSLAEEYFPIEFLDAEFKASLSEDDMIDLSIKDTKYTSILPDLKLSSSKSVTMEINPNLSHAELMEKMANLQLNTQNIKSFVDTFNQEIYEIEKIKNLKHISKTKKMRNRDYANAFFIYDLYKIIGQEFDKKILELKREAQILMEKVKNNSQYDTQEIKQHEYDKIDHNLEKHLSFFSKKNLDYEIKKITNIEISKLRGLHSLMQEYIDYTKFRNVILGQ